MTVSYQKPVTARDIMATRLITLKPDSDVFEAINLLLKHQISGAPVVDAEQQLVGMFTEMCCMRVVLHAAYEQLPSAHVANFMDRKTATITETTDVLSIVQTFVDTASRRLPVVKDGKVVGQVSRRDVIRAVSKLTQNAPEKRASLLYLSALREMSDQPEV